MQCIKSPESPLVVTHKQRDLLHKGGLSSNNNYSDTDISLNGEMCEQSACAVYVQNLCKSFNKKGPPVIDKFCMNVRKGTIYGLLGSSGCGKTTVLSCLVGLKSWDSGDVLVLGNRPGTKESGIPGKKVGYMPQDLALYNQLSIQEIIQFYGRIYNMTGVEVKERWLFLTKLLELSSKFKLIGDLSGGQKRRASLALALMHSPELLILDEPTVGLDPLLRTSIWNHLYNTVNTLGTTIIITTHYIEEARLSNRIGVMRRGRLLVEDSPLNLLSSYKCELLEQVVLQLCRKDEAQLKKMAQKTPAAGQQGNHIEFKSAWKDNVDSSIFVTRQAHELMTWGKFRAALKFDCELNAHLWRKEEPVYNVGLFSKIRSCALYQQMQRIYGLSTVIMLTFIRYPAFLIFLLCMASFQGATTLWAVGSKPRNLGIGIVNNDVGNWSYECGLPQHSGNSCDLSALSCKYINLLKTDDIIALKPYDTEAEALDQVHLGTLWGYLTIPHNYSQHTLDRAAANKFAFTETIQGSEIHMHLDHSQYIALFFMAKHISHSYLEYVSQLVESCNLGGRTAQLPLHFGEPVYGNNDDDYTQFIMPGVILTSLFGIVSSLTGLLLVTDRKQGTLDRAHAAGLVTCDIILSHLITQGIVTLGEIVIWNLVQHFLFGIVNHGAVWLTVLFCLLAGLSGAALGVLVGFVCNEEVEALIIGVFLVPIFLLFGGTFFPLENMALFWQRVGYILPTTLSTKSLRSIIVRGAGLLHSTVWPGLLVLIAWIVVLPLLSAAIYRRNRK